MTQFSQNHIRQTDYRKKRDSNSELSILESIDTKITRQTLPIEVKLLLKERILSENDQFIATLLPGSICAGLDFTYLEEILKEMGLA